MTRRMTLLIGVVLVLPLLTYAGWVGYVRLCRPHVQTDTEVGRTEGEIRASYGQPNNDRPGYHPLALSIPPSLPHGSIRTLIFHLHGLLHPEGGTLWVWLVERDGVWVCFESCWFADSVRF